MQVEIYEVNYSCSPGGIDCWELNIQGYGYSTCISDFKTAGDALNYLVKHYPDQAMDINVRSLDWYFKDIEAVV